MIISDKRWRWRWRSRSRSLLSSLQRWSRSWLNTPRGYVVVVALLVLCYVIRMRYSDEHSVVSTVTVHQASQSMYDRGGGKHVLQPPLLSIVVPVFKTSVEELLELLISVASQSRPIACEVILSVDGGPAAYSTELYDFVRRWEAQAETPAWMSVRVVFSTVQHGPASARNRAVEIAAESSRYIMPLDSDDEIAESLFEDSFPHLCLAQNYSRCARDRPNLVVSDLISKDGSYRWEPKAFGGHYTELLTENKFHCCPIMEKAVWHESGGSRGGLFFGWEDYDFFIRAAVDSQIVSHNIRSFNYIYSRTSEHVFCDGGHFVELCMEAMKICNAELYDMAEVDAAHKAIETASKALSSSGVGIVKTTRSAGAGVVQRGEGFFLNERKILHSHRLAMNVLSFFWLAFLREMQQRLEDSLELYEQVLKLSQQRVTQHQHAGLDWQAMKRILLVLRKQKNVAGIQERCSQWSRMAQQRRRSHVSSMSRPHLPRQDEQTITQWLECVHPTG